MNESIRYARKCSVTGAGMNKGYVINDGEMYIESEKHLSEHITNDTEYESVEEAYEDGYYYYTEWDLWEDEEEFEFTIDGKRIINQ